eukprot:2783365-Pyramimonas_sp.AAC.1
MAASQQPGTTTTPGVTPTKPRSRLSAKHVAVCRQGIYVVYLVEYSKYCALNGIRMSTPGLDTNKTPNHN